MEPFTKHTGLVAAMDRANVDTDQIIPKQFLKRIERTGFGQFLFFDWRFRDDGTPNPEFELNRPAVEGASILLARQQLRLRIEPRARPLGAGGLRFRVLIAPSFADIFYNNCFKNGMLPIRLDEATVDELFERAAQRWLPADGRSGNLHDQRRQRACKIPFDVEPFRRHCLLNGLDDIGLT